jgi:peptide/nickel transport system permease protein
VLPGNAAAVLLGTAARPDTVAALEHQLGLDRPAPLRYAHWLAGAVTGDLGQSAAYGVPVRGLIAERLAVTLPLTALAAALALVAGTGPGVLAAAYRGRWPDRAVAAVTGIGIAVPDFWSGLVLILVFSTGLRWTAAGGFPGWADPAAGLKALVLPAVALALPQAAVLARVTRGALLEVLEQDYVRTAWAKGAGRTRVLWRHALPNAVAPLLTLLGLQVSFLFAGAVLVETVFNLPGLGRLAAQAVVQRDLAVIRNVAMLLAAIVIAANTLVDLAQAWADPRTAA